MLTEDARQQLFHHYLITEEVIHVDSHAYRVSAAYDDPEYVCFYAVCEKTQQCGAISKLPRAQWETIDNGLCMAYLLNVALESLEEGIRHTGGKLE